MKATRFLSIVACALTVGLSPLYAAPEAPASAPVSAAPGSAAPATQAGPPPPPCKFQVEFAITMACINNKSNTITNSCVTPNPDGSLRDFCHAADMPSTITFQGKQYDIRDCKAQNFKFRCVRKELDID